MKLNFLALMAALFLVVLTNASPSADRKMHGMCSDYDSPTNYSGIPYRIYDPDLKRLITRHEGIDFCKPAGTDVIAPADGTVVELVLDNPIRGGSVTIATKFDYVVDGKKMRYTIYVRALHIDPSKSIRYGQFVKAGQLIGKVQKAGKAQIGPRSHVHLDAGTCSSPATCHVNPNLFWAEGPNKITCFDANNPPPPDKLVAPVPCSAVASVAEITGDQIKAALIDVALDWWTEDGRFNGNGRINSDGTATITNTNIPGVASDTGKWHITGDKICFTYKKLRQGKESCLTYQSLPDGNYMSSTHTIYMIRYPEMSGDDFKAKLVGVDFDWRTTDGKYKGRSRFNDNGTTVVHESNVPGQKGAAGKWRLDGNKVCIVSKAIMGGKERCVTYEARPDGTFYSSSKTVMTLVK